jgi:hypothetical protein
MKRILNRSILPAGWMDTISIQPESFQSGRIDRVEKRIEGGRDGLREGLREGDRRKRGRVKGMERWPYLRYETPITVRLQLHRIDPAASKQPRRVCARAGPHPQWDPHTCPGVTAAAAAGCRRRRRTRVLQRVRQPPRSPRRRRTIRRRRHGNCHRCGEVLQIHRTPLKCCLASLSVHRRYSLSPCLRRHGPRRQPGVATPLGGRWGLSSVRLAVSSVDQPVPPKGPSW